MKYRQEIHTCTHLVRHVDSINVNPTLRKRLLELSQRFPLFWTLFSENIDTSRVIPPLASAAPAGPTGEASGSGR